MYLQQADPIVTEGWQLVITNPVWTIITGVLLPFVIALILKLNASERFKAVVGIVVAAIAALVVRATTVDGSAVLDQALVVDIFMVYGPQLLVYLGVYKKFQLNAHVAPGLGISDNGSDARDQGQANSGLLWTIVGVLLVVVLIVWLARAL